VVGFLELFLGGFLWVFWDFPDGSIEFPLNIRDKFEVMSSAIFLNHQGLETLLQKCKCDSFGGEHIG
jgi:hypothetical protein